jgi:hypothetical protein
MVHDFSGVEVKVVGKTWMGLRSAQPCGVVTSLELVFDNRTTVFIQTLH